MKTSILTFALGASVLALAFTPATNASAEKVSATVKYSDLNLSTREGAKAMYQRVKNTARSLCGDQPDIGEIGGIDGWRSCVNDAVNDAVGRLNAPMVTAFNGGRSASLVKLAQGH